jgi:hypothetical protein
MFVLRAQLCAFLLLASLSFQQGCRTSPVTPTPKQATDAEKAESAGKENIPPGSESTKVEQEVSKKPEIAIRCQCTGERVGFAQVAL